MFIMNPENANMRGRKVAGTPVLLPSSGSVTPLEKVGFDKGCYNEAWLQKLAFEHPQVLPVTDIEPGFGEIYPVAMEVPCAHGNIDNLYVTASGDLVLVEAKLWRNPQARREVVAQALDYVAALMGTPFEEFEGACRKGQGMSAPRLYDLIADKPDALTERDFVDAVSRNLRRGRMLVIALGDGIRSEAEALVALLQSHAGAHFTFALVELAIWKNPESGSLIAVPGTLAQTVMITRGIVTVDDAGVTVKSEPAVPGTRPSSISEELYFEELERTDPKLPVMLKEFVKHLEPLGVYADQRKTLILKVDGPDKVINLGYINVKGRLWTDAGGQPPPQPYLNYLSTLANLINGKVATGPCPCLLDEHGSKPLLSQLLPEHADAWRSAISQLIMETRMGDGGE